MELTRPWVRIALWSGAAVAVALATAAYFRPEFVVDLANRIMLCF
jgi:hypothetical protein